MTTTFQNSTGSWKLYKKSYAWLNYLSPYREMFECDIIPTLCQEDPLNVLDASCGTGSLLVYSEGVLPEDTRFTCIDFEPAMLEEASQYNHLFPQSTFQQADLNETLPFPTESFDAIVSSNTIYAVKSPEETLRNFYHTLATDGILILTNPFFGSRPELILKAHCKSKESDEYWLRDRTAREKMQLVHAHIKSKIAADNICEIALHDAVLRASQTHHFFHQSDLDDLVRQCGFTITRSSSTYADQDHFLVCTKR